MLAVEPNMVLAMVFVRIHSMDWMWEFMSVRVMVCGTVIAIGSVMVIAMASTEGSAMDQMLDCAKLLQLLL